MGEELTVLRCPDFEPYNNIDSGFLWVTIKGMPLKMQTAIQNLDPIDSSSSDEIKPGGLIVESADLWVELLAPMQIMETVNHSWGQWENMFSRLGEKVRDFSQMGKDISALYNAVKSQLGGISVSNFTRNLGTVSRFTGKVDTPLVYENSERREYVLEFELVANNEKNAMNMLKIVRELEMKSSPTKSSEDMISIQLPHVFSISTFSSVDDKKAYKIFQGTELMAITSVQPTYFGPYIRGPKSTDKEVTLPSLPSRIQLTLTFKELPPLYSSNFRPEDVVT